eukprot:290725-Prorocentrum_lima.AAC.1
MAQNGLREQVTLKPYLVQLGFGGHVERKVEGEAVQLHSSMVRMAIKFSPRQGWPAGPHTAGYVANELNKHINEHSYDDI